MIIKIKDLTFYAIIGLLDFERVKEQQVVVNLKAKYDYKAGLYIDYVELCDIIKTTIKEHKFELLEDALLMLIDNIVSKYSSIKSLKIEICKPDILDDTEVSLSKKWSRAKR